MWIFVLICSIAVGYWHGRKLSDHIFIFYYFKGMMDEQRFLNFYDLNEQESFYHIHIDAQKRKEKSYAKYLKHLQDKRDTAYQDFRQFLRELLKYDVRVLVLFVLLPSLLFREYYPVYLLGFGLSFICWLLYKRVIKKLDLTFYSLLAIGSVLDLYTKKKWTK